MDGWHAPLVTEGGRAGVDAARRGVVFALPYRSIQGFDADRFGGLDQSCGVWGQRFVPPVAWRRAVFPFFNGQECDALVGITID